MADGRVLKVAEIGDNHLVHCLQMIERNRTGIRTPAGMLPPDHMRMYGVLVIEAMSRGLFDWSKERKYLTATENQIIEKYSE
jgi:hypothetical protein